MWPRRPASPKPTSYASTPTPRPGRRWPGSARCSTCRDCPPTSTRTRPTSRCARCWRGGWGLQPTRWWSPAAPTRHCFWWPARIWDQVAARSSRTQASQCSAWSPRASAGACGRWRWTKAGTCPSRPHSRRCVSQRWAWSGCAAPITPPAACCPLSWSRRCLRLRRMPSWPSTKRTRKSAANLWRRSSWARLMPCWCGHSRRAMDWPAPALATWPDRWS